MFDIIIFTLLAVFAVGVYFWISICLYKTLPSIILENKFIQSIFYVFYVLLTIAIFTYVIMIGYGWVGLFESGVEGFWNNINSL